MKRRYSIGVMGCRWWIPRLLGDPMQMRDGWCWRTGQEAYYPSEGSLTVGGVDKGDNNNTLVTISDGA